MSQNNPEQCIHPIPCRADPKIKNMPDLVYCTECKCFFYVDKKSNKIEVAGHEVPINEIYQFTWTAYVDPDVVKKLMFKSAMTGRKRFSFWKDVMVPFAFGMLIFSVLYTILT